MRTPDAIPARTRPPPRAGIAHPVTNRARYIRFSVNETTRARSFRPRWQLSLAIGRVHPKAPVDV